MPTLNFVTNSAILPAVAGTPTLSLLSLTFDEPAGDHLAIVRGISGGPSQLQIDLATDGATSSRVFNVPSAVGVFNVSLPLPNSVTDDLLRVNARHVGDGGASAVQAVVSLHQERVELPAGTVLGVRMPYLAGTADRLVRSRTFVRLDPQLGDFLFLEKVVEQKADGSYRAIDTKALNTALSPTLAAARTAVGEGRMTVRQFYTGLRAAVRKELPQHMVPASSAIGTILDRIIGHGRRDATGTTTSGLPGNSASPSGGRRHSMIAATRAVYTADYGTLIPIGPEHDMTVVVDELIKELAAYRRLGVLFHERTRFRSAGLVVGEPLYQLALVPGEEVQIRQTTETRKRLSITDLRDREEERQTALSSTLSTDMSSVIGTQASFQSSTTLGGGIEGDIPEVPVGVSADTASTVSTADSISQSTTVTDRIERTSQASAKLRSQHKIQLEITTEESNSLASTRTLRNPNSLRTVHHTFYKMYRREQVTLERHDAQLAFVLTVSDPGRLPRTEFEVGLARMDPANEDLYNLVAPSTFADEKETARINAPESDPGLFHGLVCDRWVPFAGDLRQLAGVPETHCLAAPPRFTMTECHIFFGDDNLHPTDGSTAGADVSEAELTGRTVPYVRSAGRFHAAGGAFSWHTRPRVGATDARFNLQLNMPIVYTGPTSLLGEVETSISAVRFRIETEWMPTGQALLDHRKECRKEFLRLTREFELDDVMNLKASAASDYSGSVINRALSENLVLPNGFAPERLREIFDFDYVSLSNHPYWTTTHGRGEHARLLARLLQLPVAVPLEQILTDELVAAGSTVFLPVGHGAEEEALALLPEAAGYASEVAKTFTTFRSGRYGATTTGDPTFEDSCGPTPPTATPQGESTWKTGWEARQRKFDILGQWSEIVPTDGVHIETHLSESVAVDERSRARLSRLDDLGAV